MRWGTPEPERTGPRPVRRGAVAVGRSNGFTLVEVVVVLTILAIMGAAVAPMLPRVGPEEPVDEAAERVATLLRRAQRTAFERSTPVTVIIDPEGHRYWVSVRRDGQPKDVERGELGSAVVVLSGDAPRVRCRFSPDGSASGGRLTVRAAGRARVVRVDPWTGDARVRER